MNLLHQGNVNDPQSNDLHLNNIYIAKYLTHNYVPFFVFLSASHSIRKSTKYLTKNYIFISKI